MDDPARKINKLQILSYIDDFIQNNVKVLENPRYTDIGGYHKLMEKIRSKMIYTYDDYGTSSLKSSPTEEEPQEDPLSITVNNSLSETSCTSDSTSNDVDLCSNQTEIVSYETSKSIIVKQELPEVKTEVFEFNPNEHGICVIENYYPGCLEIKSDDSHNPILYELPNNDSLLEIINNDNDTKLARNTKILHKLLTNNQIEKETPLIKEEIMISDYKSTIYEQTEMKNEDYDNSMIKYEPAQLKVETDLIEKLKFENNSHMEIVKMENNPGSDTCEFIISKKKRTLSSRSNSKKSKVPNILKKKTLNKKKVNVPFVKSTKITKNTGSHTNLPKKHKKPKKSKKQEIVIKNCSVPLVKIEDELLGDCKSKSDLLPVSTDTPMFNKLILQDMMNISAGKLLTFYSPENVKFLIDRLNQDNISSDEIILFLNTNDVVTRMCMDNFGVLETAILENKVKVIDKTVAEIYTSVQGKNVFFDTYVQQKINGAAINKHFGQFKKNIYALRHLK